MILFFKIFKFCYNYLFTLCGPVALGRFRMEAVCVCVNGAGGKNGLTELRRMIGQSKKI